MTVHRHHRRHGLGHSRALVVDVNLSSAILRAIATGTRQVGQTLTAALSDGSDLTGASYQWYRGGVAITDATAQTYTLVGADDGAEISVEIIRDATTYLSAGVTITAALTIILTGTFEPGQTVTATSNYGTATVRIEMDDVVIVSESDGEVTYDIQAADESSILTAYAVLGEVEVQTAEYTVTVPVVDYANFVDNGDGTYSIDTNQTTVTLTITEPTAYAGSYDITVADLAAGPVAIVAPAISGLAAQGSTLTKDLDALFVYEYSAGPISVAQIWQADGSDITAETGDTYVSDVGDAGLPVAIQQIATDSNGSSASSSNEIVVAGGASAFAKTDDDSLTALLQTDTEHTLSAAAIGAADADRKVVVGLMGSRTAGTATITGVTIGGVTAAKVTGISNTRCLTEWWQAPVPTGTTGDIVVTFGASAGVQGLRGIVYRSVGKTITAGVTTFANAVSASVDTSVVNGETLLGIAVGRNSGTMTWTGLTREGTDLDLGGDDYCSAGIQAITTTETRTVTMTTATATNLAAATLRIQ